MPTKKIIVDLDVWVVIVAVITAAAIACANMQTTLGQQKGSPVADSIIMRANLKRDTSMTLLSEKCTGYCYFQVSALQMNASKGSKLCPSGDCQYSIENTQFFPNAIAQLSDQLVSLSARLQEIERTQQLA